MNQNQNRSSAIQKKDYTVTKIMCALALWVISFVVLKAVAANYTMLEGFEAIYPAMQTVWIVSLCIAVAALAAGIIVKQSVVRFVCKYLFAFALLWCFTGLIFRNYLADQMYLLYFAHATVYILYIIFMLYQAEFFFVSLMTFLAGWGFYRLYPVSHWQARNFICMALLLAAIAVSVFVAFSCSKKKGYLFLGKNKWRVFPRQFNPMLIFVVGGLWLVCLLASIVFGSLFAYYAMFVCIAVELIAAVYYTFQLK